MTDWVFEAVLTLRDWRAEDDLDEFTKKRFEKEGVMFIETRETTEPWWNDGN